MVAKSVKSPQISEINREATNTNLLCRITQSINSTAAAQTIN